MSDDNRPLYSARYVTQLGARIIAAVEAGAERKITAAKANALREAELVIRALIAAHHHLSWEPPESCELGPALEAVAALRGDEEPATYDKLIEAGWITPKMCAARVADAVARAEAAEQRIAAALALADEWGMNVGQGSGHYLNPYVVVSRLRAALRGDA